MKNGRDATFTFAPACTRQRSSRSQCMAPTSRPPGRTRGSLCDVSHIVRKCQREGKKTMSRKLACTAPNTLSWVSERDREPGDGEVRIRSIFSAAKHGTDLSFYKGYASARGTFDSDLKVFRRGKKQEFFTGPVGNMVVGEVVLTGSGVDELCEGDRVTAHAPFSDIHILSALSCRKVPESVPWQSAVCLDPAACALGAVRDGPVRVGDCVAVLGMGAIGLCTVQVARHAGAALVIATDPVPERRKAAAVVGADLVLDPLSCDAGIEIKQAVEGRGADVVVDFSGSRDALQDALRGVAFGGTVVAGGFSLPYPAGLDLGAEAHLNVPNIVFSRAFSEPNREHPRWDYTRVCDTAWRLIVDGKIDGRPIVTPIVAFENVKEEYERVIPDPRAGIKLGVRH